MREEIGMNSGLGALSPFNHANSVIGRAWTLLTINLGDARLGETFMGSTGNPLNYNNMCFAENEERSVWVPFHVQKGFKKEESTVSIFRGWSAINSMGAAGCCRPAQEEMLLILQAFAGITGAIAFVMDPLVASHLKEQGFDTARQLGEWITKNFKMTAGQFFSSDLGYSLGQPMARDGVEPFASWWKLPKDALIAPYFNPDQISSIVVGGETQALWFTTDMSCTQTLSIDKWRPQSGVYKEDEQIARRRAARQKRHAAALKASGYSH
jgi:hypothetical protein